jgi:protein TonB
MEIRNNSAAKDQGSPVFENRNKVYGAYELRKSYEKRLATGLASIAGLFLLALLGLIDISSEKIPEIVCGGPCDTSSKIDSQIVILDDWPEIKPDKDQGMKIVKNEPPKRDTIKDRKEALAFVAGTISGRGHSTLLGGPGERAGLVLPKLPLLTINKPKVITFDSFYESPPSFPGGHDAYESYVNAHIHYPLDGAFIPTGRIILQLSIDPEGNILNVELKRGVGYGMDEEAMRVVRSMPKWIPATVKGRAIAIKYSTVIVIEK